MDKKYIIRQNAILLALQIFVLTLFFNLIYLFISIAGDYISEFNNGTWHNLITYDTLSYILLMIFHAILLFALVLKWYSAYYFLENGYFVNHSGIFFKDEKRIRISPSTSVILKQNWLGRMFQYGMVQIKDSASQQQVTLYAVADPQDFIASLKTHS